MNETEQMILLVEDDPAEAMLTQRALAKNRVATRVMRVENGEEAVAYLDGEGSYQNRESHPWPTLVLMDIKLPRKSGLEVLEWIRSRGSILRTLPVVMLTSSRHKIDLQRAYEYGANAYLTKPETTSELVEMLKSTQDFWLRFNELPPR